MDDKYIGKLLDSRYEILDISGVGGMAVVYKARDRALNRYVAIKVLKDELAQDEEFRSRFRNESQTVARLSHHNIVSIYDVSHTEGLNYIVMELVDGITLKEYLQKKGRLTWQEALFFAQQIARALEHAHSRGIIHQDIKPHNIMILRDATAKVTDFGIAKFAAKEETQVVKEAIGSVHYISPEQARGSTIDYRTDLYSLGVVMYEMLTGKLPFDGDNALSIVMQHISAMPLMPSEIVPSIPSGMNEIVMHAMCPTISRRYSSASELYADLERLKSDPNMTFGYSTETRGEAIESDETQKLPNFEMLSNVPIHHTPAKPVRDYEVELPPPVRREVQEPVYEERRQQPYEERRAAPRPAERKRERERERRRREEEEERFSDSPLLMVAVALLAIVLIGGVAFFWFSRFWSGESEGVEVPSFLGAVYTDVLNDPEYAQFRFDTEPREDDTSPENTVIDQNPARGDKIQENATITLYYAVPKEEDEEEDVQMEDFTDRELQTALDFLKELDKKSEVIEEFDEAIEEGRIIRTVPDAGQTIREEKVRIYVSKGPDDGPFEMPDYFNMDYSKAIADLTERGLVLDKAEPRDTNVPKDAVVDQSPEEGETVEKGTKVTLYYSSGEKPEDKPQDKDPDAQDPDETVGTGSITIPLPSDVPGDAKVTIEMSGRRIYENYFSTAQGSVTISGLEGSIGTHDVVVTVEIPNRPANNFDSTITFS